MKMVLIEYKTKDRKEKKQIKKIEKFHGKSIVDLLNERMEESLKLHAQSDYVKNILKKALLSAKD